MYSDVLQEEGDAKDVHELIKKRASQCKVLLLETELRSEQFCREVVKKHVEFHSSGLVDILWDLLGYFIQNHILLL